MIINEDDYLAHYGILRKSGRYPWGSGTGDDKVLSGGFLAITTSLRKQGLSETEIATGFKITTTQLRALRSIESNRVKQEKLARVQQLRDKGMGPAAIGKQLGINESSVRSLLTPGLKEKADTLQTIASVIQGRVDKHGYIDVGAGVESHLGISSDKLKTAVQILKEKGYVQLNIQADTASGPANQKTTIRLITRPGTTYRDAVANKDKVQQVFDHSDDGGQTFRGIKPPMNINANRVQVKYKEEGGHLEDGVMYIRRGVPDVSLGGSAYAQVRIAVGGTHYLKGMALYKDNLPDGVDIQFNTNKSNSGNKLDALKEMKKTPDGKVDLENPFGSQISRQILDKNGKLSSSMNIVNDEGTWENWNKSISTQVLSKQAPTLAKQQLDLKYEKKKQDLDEIKALTNPVVRQKLLEMYADGVDSSAVHLDAAHLPRQATYVILPLTKIKPTEIYAPKYRDGETVVLIRYPHGGKFEIPELTVNNRNAIAKKSFGEHARDAVGIHPSVAERLSGADFDGDTVVVIPNGGPRKIKSEPALKSLAGFDPKSEFAPYQGMKTIDGGYYNTTTKKVEFPPGKSGNSRHKNTQMGLVSNLITDMTIKGAPAEELARAVKHSMVVIDAEKHSLDYKASAQRHGITALNIKYQGRAQGSAATIISRATSQTKVNATKPRPAKDGGGIDRKTGQLVTVPKTYVNRFGETVSAKIKVDKLSATKDAFTLVSDKNDPIERIYAEHSNKLKALGNDARKEIAAYKPPKISPSAKIAYKPHVDSLKVKLAIARRNKPLERQAQLFARASINARLEAHPNMDPNEVKKLNHQALTTARLRVGALKTKIIPTADEWAAIQAGAVSPNQLRQMLDSADLDVVRQLATPRPITLMTTIKTTRARTMLAAGYTQSEVADALGISVSTLMTVF